MQTENNTNNTDEEILESDATIWEDKNAENTEIETLKQQLARSQADYQNLVMRSERDKKDMTFFITEKLMRGLLVQIDNLDRAVAIKKDIKDDAFVDGVRTVQSGLQKYLENNGVIAFDSIGQEVDPERHEVLSQMPGEEWKILQEFEKGYEFNGRILRHAKVVVGNGE